MNSTYGSYLIAVSRRQDLRAEAARYRQAAQARPTGQQVSLAHRVKPVLAYARYALTTLSSIAFGVNMSN